MGGFFFPDPDYGDDKDFFRFTTPAELGLVEVADIRGDDQKVLIRDIFRETDLSTLYREQALEWLAQQGRSSLSKEICEQIEKQARSRSLVMQDGISLYRRVK